MPASRQTWPWVARILPAISSDREYPTCRKSVDWVLRNDKKNDTYIIVSTSNQLYAGEEFINVQLELLTHSLHVRLAYTIIPHCVNSGKAV
jgi:hypothetical protein